MKNGSFCEWLFCLISFCRENDTTEHLSMLLIYLSVMMMFSVSAVTAKTNFNVFTW